jgi:uncharacterized protein YegL
VLVAREIERNEAKRTMADPTLSAWRLRRLPVYLLLDCSIMMVGGPIVAVNEGMDLIWHALQRDPQLRQAGIISSIRFAETAEQDEFVPVDQFTPPLLRAGGAGAALGGALNLTFESITHDLMPAGTLGGGDYRPIVCVFTVGHPTDSWREPLERLRALRGAQQPIFLALGCGAQPNLALLGEIAPAPLLMADATEDALHDLLICDPGADEEIPSGTLENGVFARDVPNVPGAKKFVL